MGAFLDKPKTDKHNENGVGNGLRYGLSSMQGWRIEMEDAHAAVANLPGVLKDWAFFAVFDGHAGAKISAHCSEHLLNSITSGEEFQPSSIAEFETDSEERTISKIKKGIHAGFLRLDESMRQMPEAKVRSLKKYKMLLTDTEQLESYDERYFCIMMGDFDWDEEDWEI